MAIIPLRQEITVYKESKEGELDVWGNPIKPVLTTLSARIDEGSFLFKDDNGDEAVAKTKVLLDKLADVWYGDEIEYKDELGRVTRRKPKSIAVKRDFGSKPLLTEIML